MSKQRLQAIENIELRGSKQVLNFHRRQKIRFVIDFPKAVDFTGKEGPEGTEKRFMTRSTFAGHKLNYYGI